jgi:hypothetical protein
VILSPNRRTSVRAYASENKSFWDLSWAVLSSKVLPVFLRLGALCENVVAPFRVRLDVDLYQGWRAEAALTPDYYLSPLRGGGSHVTRVSLRETDRHKVTQPKNNWPSPFAFSSLPFESFVPWW